MESLRVCVEIEERKKKNRKKSSTEKWVNQGINEQWKLTNELNVEKIFKKRGNCKNNE